MTYGRPAFDSAPATFDDLAAYTRPNYETADAEWTEPAQVDARAKAAGPLGVVFVIANAPPIALISAAGPLKSPTVMAQAYPSALIAVTSPLGAVRLLCQHDFTPLLTGVTVSQFVMDLVTPGGLVRVPISSFQATLSSDRQSYAGCVIPACGQWLATLATATEFVVSRRATLPDGRVIEYVMARSPLNTTQIDQGPTNHTASISGYVQAYEPNANPSATFDRYLDGVRSISVYESGIRVRCAIDWLLRPGQRAYYTDAASFIVSYINMYVVQNTASIDAYMDVGERE